MDKLTKLSEAIRYGSTFIKEDKGFGTMDGGKNGCCPIGTAYIACGFEPSNLPYGEILPRLSERFGVPHEVIELLSYDHFRGVVTRAQAADWLEAQGY